LIGCRTCASASALSFEAQPALPESVVKRMFLALSSMGFIVADLLRLGNKPYTVDMQDPNCIEAKNN